MKKFYTISEVSKKLKLINKKNLKLQNHILRYWEKEFTQIRPKFINKRRYYTHSQLELVKMIKYFLKDKGMTVKGVKNLLKSNINKLDDDKIDSLKADYYKLELKTKTNKLLDKIDKLKKYGKKISH